MSHRRRRGRLAAVLILFLLVSAVLGSASAADDGGAAGANLGDSGYFLPQPDGPIGPGENYAAADVIPGPAAVEPLRQLENPFAPALGTSFAGIDFDADGANNGSYHIPPDPHGAAGPSHVVSVVNTSIAWYNKSGTQQNNQSLKSFFTSLSPLTSTFDPKVIYDQYNGRFVVVTLERTDTSSGGAANTSRIFVAVSDDSDPNGTWHFGQIDSKINDSGTGSVDTWADYPGFAVDSQAVYITNNIFTFGSSPSNKGARLWIVNKSPLYSGGAIAFTVHNPPAAVGENATTAQPAHMFGTAPSGVGTWLVRYSGYTDGTNEALSIIRVDDPLGTPAFSHQFVNMGNVDNTGASMPDAPQLGSATKIETNDRRALNAVWRNNALWTTFQVVPGSGADAGQATARWAKVNTTNTSSLTLSDQGAVGGNDIDAGAHTFMPSVAVDKDGNMAIGFALSSPNHYAGAYYTGRLSAATAGTVQSTGTLMAGQDTYIRTFGGSSNRWGDYSGMSVDPSDDLTFWVFNEYAMTQGTTINFESGRWATRFGSFVLGSSSATATPTVTSSPTVTPTVTSSPTVTTTATPSPTGPTPTPSVTPTPSATPSGTITSTVFLPFITKSVAEDLSISRVEVIQGVTMNSTYRVHLANRAATLRAFIGLSGATSMPGVSGRLMCYDSGNTLQATVNAGPITVQAATNEGDLSHTLNFSLPAGCQAAGTSYVLQVDPDNSIVESNENNNRHPASGNQSFNYSALSAAQVTFVPVAYQPNGTGPVYNPTTSSLTYLTWFHDKNFPSSPINYQLHAPFAHTSQVLPDGTGWSALLDAITTLHTQEGNASTLYYGVINTFDAHGCSGGCVAGLGWRNGDFLFSLSSVGFSGFGAGTNAAGETFTHEAGHNYSRRHVACSGSEAGPDPAYPYAGGKLGTWGLDVATGTLYDPATYADYMSYCSKTWTSDYTFKAVHDYRASKSAHVRSLELQARVDSLYVGGSFEAGGAAHIMPLYRQQGQLTTMGFGTHRVVLRDAAGQVLAVHHFTPTEIADLPVEAWGFGLMVPYVDGVASLSILGPDSAELYRRELSPGAAAQALAIQSVNAVVNSTGGATVSWTASAVPGTVYRVRFSPDGGKTWQVLALEWGRAQFSLPAGLVSGASKPLVEIQAVDGLRTSTMSAAVDRGE